MQEFADRDGFLLRLDAGETLFERLEQFARTHELRAAAVVSGIGMLASATIGFWDGTRYVPQELDRPHELVALAGSVATVDGAPSLHLHAALAGPDYRVLGGHLLAARVGVIVELHLRSFAPAVFGRPFDEAIGLRCLDLRPGPSPPV